MSTSTVALMQQSVTGTDFVLTVCSAVTFALHISLSLIHYLVISY